MTTLASQARMTSRLRIWLLAVGAIIVAIGLAVFAMDYLQTRSEARLAVILARLGPGTPLDDYVAEFGETSYHFTTLDEMKSWGPSTDESLLAKTELYYFWYSGVPYRFVVVYVDKDTRRSVLVTWKGM